MGCGMEKINYEKLANSRIVKTRGFIMMYPIIMCLGILSNNNGLSGIIPLALVVYIIYCMYKLYENEKENRKEIEFYNDCVEKYECVLVEDDTYKLYDAMSKNVFKEGIQLIWEPRFEYEDETKVYKLKDTNIYTVTGYFKEVCDSRESKIKYIVIFIGGKYYLNCIDNVILCDKDKRIVGFYKRRWIEIARS